MQSQSIQHQQQHQYGDDVDYINDYDNDNVIINKKSTSQTPFTESLKMLRDNIEALPVFHQIEILRILYKNHITFSENKNGIFLNLSYVNLEVIHKISDYVTFVHSQESQMFEFEKKKTTLSNQYFK
jgi:signal-transduction protein with cAMP-binding, CBS, and nucleotidyltransferase domain